MLQYAFLLSKMFRHDIYCRFSKLSLPGHGIYAQAHFRMFRKPKNDLVKIQAVERTYSYKKVSVDGEQTKECSGKVSCRRSEN